jgi:DNA-binding NarL/FixJ family response regulator
VEDAERLIGQSRAVCWNHENETLCRVAEIVILVSGDNISAMQTAMKGTFDWCLSSGTIDPLICALRGSRQFTSAVATDPDLMARIAPVLERAGDDVLLRALGISTSAGRVAVNRAGLTPRELEVLKLVHQGHRNQEIAKALFISDVTVKAHLRNIYEKLGVRSRTEAAVRAAAFLSDTNGSSDS